MARAPLPLRISEFGLPKWVAAIFSASRRFAGKYIALGRFIDGSPSVRTHSRRAYSARSTIKCTHSCLLMRREVPLGILTLSPEMSVAM